ISRKNVRPLRVTAKCHHHIGTDRPDFETARSGIRHDVIHQLASYALPSPSRRHKSVVDDDFTLACLYEGHLGFLAVARIDVAAFAAPILKLYLSHVISLLGHLRTGFQKAGYRFDLTLAEFMPAFVPDKFRIRTGLLQRSVQTLGHGSRANRILPSGSQKQTGR